MGPKAFKQGSTTKDKSNCDLAYVTSFWRENQLVQTKKNSLKESSWFREPKCKVGSKVAQFFVFWYKWISVKNNNDMM
jgi:hypothetical protein